MCQYGARRARGALNYASQVLAFDWLQFRCYSGIICGFTQSVISYCAVVPQEWATTASFLIISKPLFSSQAVKGAVAFHSTTTEISSSRKFCVTWEQTQKANFLTMSIVRSTKCDIFHLAMAVPGVSAQPVCFVQPSHWTWSYYRVRPGVEVFFSLF